ncbi:MAG: FAD-dependent oxidoreductase, partial [Chloroflexi bacterium]|nr:FAD-dependent oxidoreductase [Chloroflexota bacterium]
MQFSRSLDVIARPDVLVVGAGCAGTVAAIAAARAGASTLVVERGGFAGGYITGV